MSMEAINILNNVETWFKSKSRKSYTKRIKLFCQLKEELSENPKPTHYDPAKPKIIVVRRSK